MTDAERKAHIERIRQHIARARTYQSMSAVANALELIVDLLEESKS